MENQPRKQNTPHTTDIVSVQQLTALANQLGRWGEEIRLAIETAKEHDLDGLACYYWTSAETGVKRLKTFTNALEESRLAVQMGKPIEIGKLKPRSTAKKSKKEIEAMVTEDLKALETHRASKKKSKPE